MSNNRSNINLDAFMSEYIHRPVPKTGDNRNFPLYSRNDGRSEGGAKDADWIEASKRVYNSPNNIKRLFITADKVVVHYYKPIHGMDSSLEKVYSFKNNRWGADIQTEINMLAQGMPPQQSRFSKTGLGALKRWSCSNLEEVYMDLSLFTGTDTMQIIGVNFIQLVASGKVKGVMKDSQIGGIIEKLFKEATLTGNQDIHDIFPRLRVVGFVQQLSKVIEMSRKMRDGVFIRDIWALQDDVSKTLGVPNNACVMYTTKMYSKENPKFFTRDYYTFDANILSGYFEECKRKIEDYIREQNKQTSGSVRGLVGEKEGYEIFLDKLREKAGDVGVYVYIKSWTGGLDVTRLTEEGKNTYTKLVESMESREIDTVRRFNNG